MRGAVPRLSQYAFMAWCSVKSIGTVARWREASFCSPAHRSAVEMCENL
jgi:hypothetical protein